MNTSKLLVATLFGFLGYFFAGFVNYTTVFAAALANACPGLHTNMRADADTDMGALVFGNLAAAFLLAYIFERWAGIRTWMAGAIAGAMIGALIALSFDSMMHGTTTLMSWSGVFIDAVVYAINSAIAGALVGWWLGFKRA